MDGLQRNVLVLHTDVLPVEACSATVGSNATLESLIASYIVMRHNSAGLAGVSHEYFSIVDFSRPCDRGDEYSGV